MEEEEVIEVVDSEHCGMAILGVRHWLEDCMSALSTSACTGG